MQLRFDSATVAVVAVVADVAAAAATAASAATAVPAVGHDNAVIGATNRKLLGLRRNIVDRRLLLGRESVGHLTGVITTVVVVTVVVAEGVLRRLSLTEVR